MAEPRVRAGKTGKRRRPARALLLMSAIIAIVFSGLFMARSASASPVAKAVPVAETGTAAPAAPAAHAAPAATSANAATSSRAARVAGNQLTAFVTPAQLDAGICNVPGVGDIRSEEHTSELQSLV